MRSAISVCIHEYGAQSSPLNWKMLKIITIAAINIKIMLLRCYTIVVVREQSNCILWCRRQPIFNCTMVSAPKVGTLTGATPPATP